MKISTIPRNEEGQTNIRKEKISDRVKNNINEQNKEQRTKNNGKPIENQGTACSGK